jgi:large subunit ribosomal protein LX
MKAFRVTGTFLMGRAWQRFRKEVAAPDKDAALEKIYSDLGSKHRVKRRAVRVRSIEELPKDAVTNPVVAHLVEETP